MTRPTGGFRSSLFAGAGEMALRIREFDWSRTPLGPIEGWHDALLVTLNLMLRSPFPTILSWGPEMVFLYNDAAIPTLNTKHPRALGGRYREVFREAWDLVGPDVEACLFRGETAVRDNIFIPILFNGVLEDHYWSYSLIPVYDGEEIGGVYDAFRNMTETVVGAQKLRESEAKLKLATEVGQLGVFLWDPDQDRSSWENDRVYEIFGRKRERGPVNGEEFVRDFLHPDSRASFREAVDQTVQFGNPLHFEGLMNRADNRLCRIELHGNLQPGGGSSRGTILGTIRDITEIRKTEELLRKNTKHLGELAAIVSSSEDVILSKDLNGIITSWNDAATRVFGFTAEEMIGESILKIIPEHLHSDERIILDSIRAGRPIKHFETARQTKDGRLIEVSLTVSPIKDETGRVIGASKIIRDVSQRKLLEQSLLQAEKIAATGRMAATIAHEINNPLESVTNLLFLLRSKIVDEEGMAFLSTAEIELGRVSHIAKQTLGYYREHAAASLASVEQLVEHVLAIYEPRCTSVGIKIERHLSPSRKICLRRGEMMQVFSNLITNSIYAMPAGGALSLSVSDTDSPSDGVLVTIADNGVGIAADVLPRVFDAFFTKRPTVGTGIGLFVAKQFVEGHRGKITIESDIEPERRGTVVRVFLPLHNQYEAE
jgi:PAS domain S-box-containing protein